MVHTSMWKRVYFRVASAYILLGVHVFLFIFSSAKHLVSLEKWLKLFWNFQNDKKGHRNHDQMNGNSLHGVYDSDMLIERF